MILTSTIFNFTGTEQSEDGRETPRSPALTASVAGSSNTERGSTSSDSVIIGSYTNTDHTVNERHSTNEFISKVSLPKGLTASTYLLYVCGLDNYSSYYHRAFC